MSQQIHRSDPRILSRRTLARDHSRLQRLLRPGMRVLDVGCGTGAITADIAQAVAPDGIVVGVDRDEKNLAVAREERGGASNLTFRVADVSAPEFAGAFDIQFDLVTTARMLLWVSQPEHALRQMLKVARPDGRIVALDYNLDETRWEPEPPAAFRSFYRAFLEWRAANGWDNAMARHLPAHFESAGLSSIEIHQCDEVVRRGDPGFSDAYASRIWLYVVESVGPKIVASGFLDEPLRAAAQDEFGKYSETSLMQQTMFVVTVEGVVPAARQALP